MYLVLGFVFLLCLLLLVMIFGEQLSILGAFHLRWLSALAEGIADLWDSFCDAVDRGFSFVLEHLWWVLAVGSGSTGLLLITWMMFGGVVERATADIAGRTGRVHAGGILDQIPEIDNRLKLQLVSFDRSENPIAQRVDQVPSPTRRFEPERNMEPEWISPRRDHIDSDFSAIDFSTEDDDPLRNDGPSLPEFPRRRRLQWDRPAEPPGRNPSDPGLDHTRSNLPTLEPDSRSRSGRNSLWDSRWTWEDESQDFSGDDRFTETTGTTVATATLKNEIEFALNRLQSERSDSWSPYDRFSDRRRNPDRLDVASPVIREATFEELETIESEVRIVSGSEVAESDLQIEKRTLAADTKNEFDIEISVLNRSRRHRMSGLLIREELPFRVQPVSISEGGVYRDSKVTWVIDDLRPMKSQVVRVRVRAESGRAFESQTEVSAVAAVASEIRVRSDRRTDFAPGTPDVRMTMGHVPSVADVGEELEIPFRLRNAGTASASKTVLRIELPHGLDHFHLDKTDTDRFVFVSARNLKPGGTRDVMLRLLTTEPGEQLAVVELMEKRQRLDLKTFTIRVRERDDDPSDRRPLRPEPDPLSRP